MQNPPLSLTSSGPASPAEVAARVGSYWRVALDEAVELNLDVGPIFDYGLAELARTGLLGAANRQASFEMWQQAGEILAFGWLQMRAREKPRGYAGDHEMLGAIYQQHVTADPRGAAFDHYFLRLAAPRAVCNRMHLVRDRITELLTVETSHRRIIVVGSGSALEVADALRLAPDFQKSSLQLRLLDLDPLALVQAEENLRPYLGSAECLAETENLVRLPKKAARLKEMAGADLVICTGFFDYLDDSAARELLAVFWNLLAPGGEALVFNFAPWNSTRTYMEWIGNWYLIYRTRQNLIDLARGAGVSPSHFQIQAEASGIDLLLSLRKPV